MKKEHDIECQCCGEPATGKVFLCDSAECQLMAVGRPRRGRGGGPRVGPRYFGGGRRASARAFGPLFRPYYGRYYNGYLGNPLWRRYGWYSYYRNFPPYSPFWYLLSLHPNPADPFWITFGYYPPDDPYWLQYQAAVGTPPYYGVNNTSTSTSSPAVMDFGAHLCEGGNEKGHGVVFTVSTLQHGRDAWVISEKDVVFQKKTVVGDMTPSMWDSLITVAERMAPGDWTGLNVNQKMQQLQQKQGSDSSIRYRMRVLSSGYEYELGGTSLSDTTTTQQQPSDTSQQLYTASDMRTLLNLVTGATMKRRERGSDVLFNAFTQYKGCERGTLVMASGRVFEYDLAHCDATLEDKLKAATRVENARLGEDDMKYLSDIAVNLGGTTSYAIGEEPTGAINRKGSTLMVSYGSTGVPVLVLAKGRLQTHYNEAEDARLAHRFAKAYKKLV